MKIIWDGNNYMAQNHAWDGEWSPQWRKAICGALVANTDSDDAATEVTCGSCLRSLAARGLGHKLQPITGHD